MLNIFKKRQTKVDGFIGTWGLTEWWLNSFTQKEQNQIVTKLVEGDMFKRGNIYTKGKYYYDNSELPKELKRLPLILMTWAATMNHSDTKSIAFKLADKAESLLFSGMDIVDLYYYYQTKIGIYYRHRNLDQKYLQTSIDACKKQIEIAPNAKKEIHKRDMKEYGASRYDIHNVGFKQLRIIEEKRGNYKEALALAIEAKNQGWAGNWVNDIERLNKKIAKTQS